MCMRARARTHAHTLTYHFLDRLSMSGKNVQERIILTEDTHELFSTDTKKLEATSLSGCRKILNRGEEMEYILCKNSEMN